MEDYFERVVARLTGAGYRWYETANFCRADAEGRDLRARHNLAYWLGRDYLGLGIGAVSTIENRRWRNTPRLGRYLEALAAGRPPERELEPLDGEVRARERVMLGLRLDEPLPLGGLRSALDADGLARAEQLGLAVDGGETLALTRRGRFLGGGGDGRDRRVSRQVEADAQRLKSPANAGNSAAQRTAAGDPPPRRRGVRRHRTAGRLEDARRALRPARLAVDGPRRAGGAREPRAAHASAHVRGTRADRARLPLLRRRAARAASSRSRPRSRSTSRRRATRSSRRCRRRPRCSRRSRGCSRSSPRRRSRRRTCGTWRCCSCSRSW